MGGLSASHLRRWADELDAEDRSDRERELEAKVDRLEAALASSGLSEDDRAALENARARLDALEAAGAAADDDRSGGDDDDGAADDDGGNGDGRRRRRTRPGRKSGAAYDWTVDDDGNVLRSEVAVVYTGPDEPDRVPLEGDEGDEE